MESDLQSLLENGTLSPTLVDKMKQLAPGAYCTHKSWGFGKIREWNTSLDQVVIDFAAKSGHTMKFQYAAESLAPIGSSHIHVQKSEDLTALKTRTSSDQVGVLRDAILSLGTAATGDAIQALLSPDVIPAADWKKWWESGKKALKKDGYFNVPTKKTDAFSVLESGTALHDRAIDDFRAALGPKAQLTALVALGKKWSEINKSEIAVEVLTSVAETLAKTPQSQLSLKVELALARDEFASITNQPEATGPAATVAISPTKPKALSYLLEQLPSVRQSQLLIALQKGLPSEFEELFLQLLPAANARVAEGITTAFEKIGRSPLVAAQVNKLIRERNVTSDFLYWLCKSQDEIFAKLFEPQLMLALLSILERDQFGEIKKGTKLYELIVNDKDLIALILKDARTEDVRDITRAIILTPVFEELDKRSLLAKIIKLYPEIQTMIAGGEKTAEEAVLIVSWESLERRKNELDDLITKKIPQNSQDIKTARGYGDLRENHEFKSAKEMQTVLMKRKAELESMLGRSQGTDFSNVDTKTVNPGTIVTLKEGTDAKDLILTILGAWDSEPTQGIVSYLTALGRGLMGHKVGDSVEIHDEDGKARSVTITSIKPYKVA